MKEIKLNGNTVALYNDIEEMPIENYNLFNEYSLLQNDIGSNISDIDKHFHKLDTFLAHNKVPEAIQERKNLHQTFWNVFEQINFPSLQFAVCMKSINGEAIEDYTQDNLKKLIEDLSKKGLNMSTVKATIFDVKKKFKAS